MWTIVVSLRNGANRLSTGWLCCVLNRIHPSELAWLLAAVENLTLDGVLAYISPYTGKLVISVLLTVKSNIPVLKPEVPVHLVAREMTICRWMTWSRLKWPFIYSIWCVCWSWFNMLSCACFWSLLFVVVSQKTATAVAHCKRGNGLIKVNGRPLEMVEPATLQYKVRPHVTGGDHQGLMGIRPQQSLNRTVHTLAVHSHRLYSIDCPARSIKQLTHLHIFIMLYLLT